MKKKTHHQIKSFLQLPLCLTILNIVYTFYFFIPSCLTILFSQRKKNSPPSSASRGLSQKFHQISFISAYFFLSYTPLSDNTVFIATTSHLRQHVYNFFFLIPPCLETVSLATIYVGQNKRRKNNPPSEHDVHSFFFLIYPCLETVFLATIYD